MEEGQTDWASTQGKATQPSKQPPYPLPHAHYVPMEAASRNGVPGNTTARARPRRELLVTISHPESGRIEVELGLRGLGRRKNIEDFGIELGFLIARVGPAPTW
jgi:hypothetical protein